VLVVTMTPVMYSDISGYFITKNHLPTYVSHNNSSEDDRYIFDFSTRKMLLNYITVSNQNLEVSINDLDDALQYNPDIDQKNKEWSALVGMLYASGVWGIYTAAGGIASVSLGASILIGFGIAVVAFVVVAVITYMILDAIDSPYATVEVGT
jgi:hypothetical protein